MNDVTGLDGYQQRFIQLNGGLTQKQLGWLKEQLTKAKNLHEKVIILGKQIKIEYQMTFAKKLKGRSILFLSSK
jgi:hypothetical protein